MTLAKNTLVGVMAVAVIGAGVWFGGNYFATQKAEEKARAYLAKHKLENSVMWEKLSARLDNTATLNKVEITVPETGKKLFIQQLDVKNFEDSDKEFKLDITFNGVSDESGKSPVAAFIAETPDLQELDLKELPLLNGTLKLEHEIEKGNVDFSVMLNQEKAVDMEFALDIKDASGFIALAKDKRAELERNPFQAFAALSTVRLDDLSVAFYDKGLVEKSAKQNKVPDNYMQECENQLVMMGIEKHQEFCKSADNFFRAEKKNLKISLDPKEPYPLGNLINLTQSPEQLKQVFKELNINVSN
ncbi:hypothetical protein V757_10650 [Pelistega indica]|uniref:DUF945 family protein n=1 Tax=Pelistega indica TaxID=1414851 RepID=V8FVS0_9BURK|nr:hypothetical protein [Pelistega indica]ETD67951.1 hypothetical protein V757_10650 [Pelistega indica]